tara:strand:- start:1636 stop:1812 length:177 start_codon:yes stop_codon:yes gene_type:complete
MSVKKPTGNTGHEWIEIDVNGEKFRITAKKGTRSNMTSIVFDAPDHVKIHKIKNKEEN